MKFKLYEGRRIVPHTKAEMGISTRTDTQIDLDLDTTKSKGSAKLEITPDTGISVAFEWGSSKEAGIHYSPAKRYRTFAKFDNNDFWIDDTYNGILETLTKNYQVSSAIPFNERLRSSTNLADADYCCIVIELSRLTYPGVKRLTICYTGEIADNYTIIIDRFTITINGQVFAGKSGEVVWDDTGLRETFKIPNAWILTGNYYAKDFNQLFKNFLNKFLDWDAIKFIQSELEEVSDEI